MINHDYSYITVSKELIEQNIAKKSVFWIKFNGNEKDCLKARKYFENNYSVYQLNVDRGVKEYDLFYWSNEGITGSLNYFTITITGHDRLENANQTITRALSLAEKVDELCPKLKITIQYKEIIDKTKVEKLAKDKYEELHKRFVINSLGIVGRIKWLNDHYGFFRKGARTRYTLVNPIEILNLKEYRN